MEVLAISATQYSPYVHFDSKTRTLLIQGVSRPENTVEFYQPVLSWLDTFFEQSLRGDVAGASLKLTLDMDYFNSISAKYLMGIILKCKQFLASGGNLSVEWIYKSNDEENREWGEDFSAISGVPFEMREK